MADATTTTSSGPPAWLVPYYQNYLNGATQVANRPYQQYQGPRVAGMSDITQNALGQYQGNMGGNSSMWGAQNFLNNVTSGQYGNPAMQQMTNTITSDADRQFQQSVGSLNDVFSNPNAFGGARHQLAAGSLTQDFGKGLAASLGNLQYGAFNDDMNRRMSATSQTAGMNQQYMNNLAQGAALGNIPRQIQQQQYDTGYNDFQNWFNYPMQQSQFLGNALGTGGSRFGVSNQTSPGPSTASQLIGGGMLALGGLGATGAFGNSGWMTGANGLFS